MLKEKRFNRSRRSGILKQGLYPFGESTVRLLVHFCNVFAELLVPTFEYDRKTLDDVHHMLVFLSLEVLDDVLSLGRSAWTISSGLSQGITAFRNEVARTKARILDCNTRVIVPIDEAVAKDLNDSIVKSVC